MNGSLRPTLYPDRTAVRMDGSDCSARARPKPTSYCLSATLSGLLKTDDNFLIVLNVVQCVTNIFLNLVYFHFFSPTN